MRSQVSTIVLFLAIIGITGCQRTPESTYGFRLPDGDAQAGREAFENLNCYACHTTTDAAPTNGKTQIGSMTVKLGGDVTKVKTYAELVTSIINPSHKIESPDINPALLINGRSAMETAQLNQHMTVAQLVDLVAYLQPLYEVTEPTFDPYQNVYP